jgi:UDP-N-acetyl-D-glucosamine dehydrogenase
VAYKRDVNDMRESPALDVIELLRRRGASVSYTDPFVPTLSHGGEVLESIPFDQAVGRGWDCVIVATDHAQFDYARIAALPLVVDTRNACKSFNGPGRIFKL